MTWCLDANALLLSSSSHLAKCLIPDSAPSCLQIAIDDTGQYQTLETVKPSQLEGFLDSIGLNWTLYRWS